jgi:hypothetical protein
VVFTLSIFSEDWKMIVSKRSYGLLLILVLSLVLPLSTVAQKKGGKKAKPKGTPVLWQEPADITSRNLFLGPGGESNKPDLSKVTFVEKKTGGYSTKYRVLDGSGNEWVVKVGKEAQSDTVASRLVWAIGYPAEISYLVPRVTIEKLGELENARFEARPKDIDRAGIWSWDKNPFIGTKEFQGLKVLMLLINNWDIKDDNNKILVAEDKETGEAEFHYAVSDLGGTLGKTGGFASRTRNKPSDFLKSKFIERVERGRVIFNYNGKRQDLFRDITVEQARWVGELMSRLSEQQIRDALRAANYDSQEAGILERALAERINDLKNVGR